jgi:hypothetical protein
LKRYARPQDCEIRLSRDALLDLLAEAFPGLDRFDLEVKADTISTLYGAKLVIDDAAQDGAITVTSPMKPGDLEPAWRESDI